MRNTQPGAREFCPTHRLFAEHGRDGVIGVQAIAFAHREPDGEFAARNPPLPAGVAR
jgi:hypothetical protein